MNVRTRGAGWGIPVRAGKYLREICSEDKGGKEPNG